MKDRNRSTEDYSLPEHVRRNRLALDNFAQEYNEPGRRAWAQKEPSWGGAFQSLRLAYSPMRKG
jgi:hypothetical protein